MSSEHPIQPFGSMSLFFPFTKIRKKALEKAADGNKKSFYSQINRTAAKFLRQAYDIEWEGLKLRVYPRENFKDKTLFNIGIHSEHQDLAYLKKLYEGQILTVVDIGGNVGTNTLFLWKVLAKESTILSYEPSPDTFMKLVTNIDFNQATNVTAVNLGIGEKRDHMWLYQINKKNVGQNTLVPTKESTTKTKIEIVPLAEDLETRHISQVDILKIDIEGYEDRALNTYLRSCDKSSLPKHIMIEDNRSQWQENCFEVLETFGYELSQQFGPNHHYRINH